MFKIKIYGAGSIGNHLAYACRQKNWDVLICDIDSEALERTKNDIYPARYGKWDDQIQLTTPDSLPDEEFDVVIIGTPPDTHMGIALDIIKKEPPKVMLIEKPLCKPDLAHCQELLETSNAAGTKVLVGYNHTTAQNTKMAQELLKSGVTGEPLAINVRWLEYWGGIFAAHPWLNGPQDSYLGFSERGGGACGEHSHAINIWQHFAHILGKGRITEVSSMLDIVDDGRVKYDRICQLSVRTERGLIGTIVQDVITEHAIKTLRIQGDKGFMEWYVNYNKGYDAVFHGNGHEKAKENLISKTRPDDFKGEIEHIAEILGDISIDSPIQLQHGLDTMMVIAAAHKSYQQKKTVRINYEAGYCPEAISCF